jgi:hypothetical protein
MFWHPALSAPAHPLLVNFWLLTSAHPQTASFGPERRFRSFEILDVARYASGLKIAQALL